MRYAEGPKDVPVSDVTAELFLSLSKLLIDTAQYLSGKYHADNIYMAGGVASSRTFRAIAGRNSQAVIHFGAPELSGDNAVGTAILAKRMQ